MRGRLAVVTRGRAIALVFLLLTLRLLSLVSVYFYEEDEVSLAVGAAALVAGTPGYMYRYAVQLGYYRLIEGLTLILGGGIWLVPWVMKVLSAVAGTALPCAGWCLFRKELSPRQRLLLVAVLALNPVIWQSSRYGNTALISAVLSTWALAALSNPLPLAGRLVALAAMAAAVLVRADAVLLFPVVGLLLQRATRSWTRAFWELAGLSAALGVVYALLFTFDPRVDGAAAAVAKHMSDTPNPSMFWEYLLWAVSPVPAVFAVWGARRLLETRPQLLGVLCVWMLPTLLFYFRATTTTRYFLNVSAPLAVLTVVGMSDAVRLLRRWWSRRMAWSVVGAASLVHLVIALGHVPPPRPLEYLYGGTFTTHDGPMPTGALLARSLLTPGSLLRSLPSPTFGVRPEPFWEGASFSKAVTALAALTPPRTVLVRLSGGYGHAFHFHTQAAGAHYDTGPTDAQDLWGGQISMRLGQVHVITVAAATEAFRSTARFDLAAGDEVWLLDEPGTTSNDVLAKLPPGLTLLATAPLDQYFRRFAVVHGETPAPQPEGRP